MRNSSLPVIVPALTLLLAGQVLAQSQIRFAGVARAADSTSSARRTEEPKVCTASHVIADEPAAQVVDDSESGSYAAGAYAPAESAPGINPGCAFGGPGGNGSYNYYGYNPDFGNLQGGMSVWPGVPACCDPWFGYCSEPRCYKCNCHQGRYLYYHCRHGACQPELLIWGKDCKDNRCCRPVAMCYPAAAGGKGCATCRSVSCGGASNCTNKACGSDSCCGAGGTSTAEPAIKPTPESRPAPPRNDLPTTHSHSARRSVQKS